MKIVWRILLIVALALAGMYLGLFIGAKYFVPKSAGLASGAMALGYAVLGLVVFALIGVVVASVLKANALRNTALIIGVPVILGYLVFTTIFVIKLIGDREPNEAFAAAGQFTVVMERLNTRDPYLFVKMEINSIDRTWVKTGPKPDSRVFYASMRSATLIDIRTALDALAAMSTEDLARCRKAEGPVIKRLNWNLIDAKASPSFVKIDTLAINMTCLSDHPAVARALLLVERASEKRGGKVKVR